MLSEFKIFILRGNVLAVAVGIIIGAAFQKIIISLVDNVLMPPIGLLLNNVDFSQLKYVLQKGGIAADGTEINEVAIGYGVFIQVIIQFVIIAICVFMVVRAVNKLHDRVSKKEEAAAPAPQPSKEEVLLTEIRDLLKAGR